MTVQLSPCQEIAKKQFMKWLNTDEKLFVIKGGPGRGKTFLTKHLLELAQDKVRIIANLKNEQVIPINIFATAPSNQAAKQLQDAIGINSSTIHSLLKIRPVANYDTGNYDLKKQKNFTILKNSILIIDEASMIDNKLFNFILESTVECKIIALGDPNQILAVKPATHIPVECPVTSKIYKNTIAPIFELPLNSVELNTPMRFKVNSGIDKLVSAYKNTVENKAPFPNIKEYLNGKDVIWLSPKEALEQSTNDISSSDWNPNKSRILAWSNKTVIKHNNIIRKAKNFPEHISEGEQVITNNPILDHHHKVIAPIGATAKVTRIGKSEVYSKPNIRGREVELKGNKFCTILIQPDDFNVFANAIKIAQKNKDWETYFNLKESFGDLRPAYASTVDKAQGSTYDTVYVNLTDIGKCNNPDRVARMLYVSCSRAKNKIVFFGSLPNKYLR